ncbi:hypothetical protein PV08_09775 [Exophiala spinifera]|uniref:Major facilitator superfamily (MFS) profile domain-containing protein n=1 Tax=Exophiala spinifera TaxID=91928 RepID=A0A0D2B0U5_9EURO|nr:uncharacterized protein PV08_09775 [Exophiala spinifera]KIW12498.1 hypothetical protein PV08_09775 [Exophiala spinifera]
MGEMTIISQPTGPTGTDAEQRALLLHAQYVKQVEDGYGDQKLSSTPHEPLAFKVVAVMYSWFVTGMHVASIGALLPLIESYYDIKDATAALIFPVGVSGYLIGNSLVHLVHVKFGRRGIAVLGTLPHVVGGIILSSKPGYPFLLAAYFITGFGTGFSDSSFCTWAAVVRGSNKVSGLIHGSYAFGCVVGPVVVAALEKAGLGWQYFYFVMLVVFVVETWTLIVAFRHDDAATHHSKLSPKQDPVGGFAGCKEVIFMCGVFFFVIVGIETSLSGWLTSYMERSRHTAPSVAALATSLFWCGMVLGRFCLGPLTRLARLRNVVILLICTLIALQLLFRFEGPLALSLCLAAGIGFASGPLFPSAVLTMTAKLPTDIQLPAVALTCAIGQLGGAGAPFVIGIIAQSSGIESLFDVVLGLSLALLLIWLVFSRA